MPKLEKPWLQHAGPSGRTVGKLKNNVIQRGYAVAYQISPALAANEPALAALGCALTSNLRDRQPFGPDAPNLTTPATLCAACFLFDSKRGRNCGASWPDPRPGKSALARGPAGLNGAIRSGERRPASPANPSPVLPGP